MRLIILFFILIVSIAYGQSPHGNSLTFECSVCHNTSNNNINFDHSLTKFALNGSHINNSCNSCHTSLEFNKVKKNCFECHVDIHQGSLDKNCIICHNTSSWTINNLKDIHRNNRFPLVGSHNLLECNVCHKNSNVFKYDVLGVNCYDCHQNDFNNAKNPNHIAGNYSTNCYECHRAETMSWKSEITDHSFFPLIAGHNLTNCFDCHTDSKYTGLNKTCISCHQKDFNATTNPNHVSLGFNANECEICHTLTPNWLPARFELHNRYYPLLGSHSNLSCINCHKNNFNTELPTTCFGCHETDYNLTTNPPHLNLNFSNDCTICHDQISWSSGKFAHDVNYFPIYTGLHNSVWNNCNDCHNIQSNYSTINCLNCHEHNKPDTDLKHSNINGYRYNSLGCLDCHPQGKSSGAYNHNLSGFLLTGAHLETRCNVCHTQSTISGTCSSCHISSYNSATNPNHTTLGFDTDCSVCHSTQRGWEISQFTLHNNYYIFEGAHLNIKDNCILCHKGNYNNTSSECSSCHIENYNNTTQPPHQTLNFSTKCNDCHNQNSWKPATFNHDAEYFPIFTGSHSNKWDNCIDCHRVPGNYSQFSCIDCHAHNNEITDDVHVNIQAYVYSSRECLVCHPTGVALGSFNHVNAFPLIGAHGNTTCDKCHLPDTYSLNKTECYDCHNQAFAGATRPHHIQYGFQIECNDCHTVEYGWKVYKFDKHDEYYPLLGKHKLLLKNCESCHPENYQNTPAGCYSCHYNNYVNTTQPNHLIVGFGNDCAACHTPNGWSPSTFPHDNQYFPIYSGEHAGSWENCNTCHTTPNVLTQYSCLGCHNHSKPEMDNRHLGVSGYTYFSDACFACHPAGTSAGAFNHANSSLPLLGVHASIECSACHISGFTNLSNTCFNCHEQNYTRSVNPNHVYLGIPQDCSMCHTPEPQWVTNIFPIHNNYYPLIGAHSYSNITCFQCHKNDYNNTPKTCVGCHLNEYNSTQNPSHLAANFPMECDLCHNQSSWIPALFNHDGEYFPIFSGTHTNVWNDCSNCHAVFGNYQVFECINCHEHNQAIMDLKHTGVQGYFYKSPDCYNCHPNGKVNNLFIKKNNLKD